MEVKEVSFESHIFTHCYGQIVCVRGTFSAGNHAVGVVQILPVNVRDFAEGELRNHVLGKQEEVDKELAKFPKHNVPKDKSGWEGEYGKDTSGLQDELDKELKYSRDRTQVADKYSHNDSGQVRFSQMLLALISIFFSQMI